MNKKVPTILFIATLLCIAVYIGVFIGRAFSWNITSLPDAQNHIAGTTDPASLLLDLNTATEDDLLTLPCMDSYLAKSILQYRQKFGGFIHISELKNVDGMTNDIYRQLKEYVTVSP